MFVLELDFKKRTSFVNNFSTIFRLVEPNGKLTYRWTPLIVDRPTED